MLCVTVSRGVAKAIVRAVCLINDDHNVAAIREQRVLLFAELALSIQAKLLERGEVDATGGLLRQQLTQLCTRLDIARSLRQDGGPVEGLEELLIQLGTVIEHNDGRAEHLGPTHNLGGVELHLHGLARTRRVPDDASAFVAARRRDRGTHSLGHREVLVRLRDAHD